MKKRIQIILKDEPMNKIWVKFFDFKSKLILNFDQILRNTKHESFKSSANSLSLNPFSQLWFQKIKGRVFNEILIDFI